MINFCFVDYLHTGILAVTLLKFFPLLLYACICSYALTYKIYSGAFARLLTYRFFYLEVKLVKLIYGQGC